jgi:transposase
MIRKKHPEEFKIEAVKQFTIAGHSVVEGAKRVSMTTHSLYAWIKRYDPDSEQHKAKADEAAEIRRLQKELKWVTEERDLLKKRRRASQVTPSKIRLYQGASDREFCT